MSPLSPASASPLHLSFDRSQWECDSAPEAAPGAPSRAPPARSEDLVQTPPRRGKVPPFWGSRVCAPAQLRLFSVPFLFLCRALAPMSSLSPQGTQLSQLRPLQATYFPQGNRNPSWFRDGLRFLFLISHYRTSRFHCGLLRFPPSSGTLSNNPCKILRTHRELRTLKLTAPG